MRHEEQQAIVQPHDNLEFEQLRSAAVLQHGHANAFGAIRMDDFLRFEIADQKATERNQAVVVKGLTVRRPCLLPAVASRIQEPIEILLRGSSDPVLNEDSMDWGSWCGGPTFAHASSGVADKLAHIRTMAGP